MNLEQALYEFTKDPVPMIGKDGRSKPALYYSKNLDLAIKWMIDRYNDGTLKVEGYNHRESASRKMIEYHRQNHKKELDYPDHYMKKKDFIAMTGLGLAVVNTVGMASGAFHSDNKTTTPVYVDVPTFLEYFQNEYKKKDRTYNTHEAAKLLDLPLKEVKRLVQEGVLKVRQSQYQAKKQRYMIFESSINEYLENNKKKGDEDGEKDGCYL